jgi:hypothetical protein
VQAVPGANTRINARSMEAGYCSSKLKAERIPTPIKSASVSKKLANRSRFNNNLNENDFYL